MNLKVVAELLLLLIHHLIIIITWIVVDGRDSLWLWSSSSLLNASVCLSATSTPFFSSIRWTKAGTRDFMILQLLPFMIVVSIAVQSTVAVVFIIFLRGQTDSLNTSYPTDWLSGCNPNGPINQHCHQSTAVAGKELNTRPDDDESKSYWIQEVNHK